MLATRARAAAAGAGGANWWEEGGATGAVAVYDFAGAASLADAVKVGSTPTVSSEPPGGLNITANGLECAADTSLSLPIRFNGSLAEFSIAIQVASQSGAGSAFLAFDTVVDTITLDVNGVGNLGYRVNTDLEGLVTGFPSNYIVTASDNVVYYNGVLDNSLTGGTANVDAAPRLPSNNFTGTIVRFAAYDNRITADQHTAIYAAMNAL